MNFIKRILKIFKKKKKYVQPTIEYIEEKYGIKLTYPNQNISFKDFGINPDGYYNELIHFGCSNFCHGSSCLMKSVRCGPDYTLENGKFIKISEGNCKNCNYYPVKKEYEDSQDIRKVRIKKLNKLSEWKNQKKSL